MRCLLPLYEILLPEAIMSVARSRLIQRFGRDWMIYALFHCGVEYLISQNSGFWDSLYVSLIGFDYPFEEFLLFGIKSHSRPNTVHD